MIHDKSILVGACDWDHPEWQQTFYPQDLPVDWRLSFYANEFSAVLVPEAKWRAEDADFEQWAEDAGEGFRFYFLTDELEVDDTYIKAQLQNSFGGFVAAVGNAEVALINYATKNLRGWKDWLLTAKVNTVFLMDEDLSVKQLAEFQSLLELMGL